MESTNQHSSSSSSRGPPSHLDPDRPLSAPGPAPDKVSRVAAEDLRLLKERSKCNPRPWTNRLDRVRRDPCISMAHIAPGMADIWPINVGLNRFGRYVGRYNA